MKTVSGHVVSSKPISLPKAAKILSKFVTVENGASHATSAYLQSASTAFDELAHLHKELKAPKSEHKSKHCELDCTKELESTKVEEKGGDFSEQSSNKKQKKKGGDDGSLQDNGVAVKERKSSRKRREHEEIEEGREEGGFMQHPNKKLKKRKNSDEH